MTQESIGYCVVLLLKISCTLVLAHGELKLEWSLNLSPWLVLDGAMHAARGEKDR